MHARALTVFAPTHRSMSFAVARGDAMCVRQAVKVTASGVGRVARRAAFVRASSRSASSSPQPASPRAAFSAAPLASFGRVGALPSPGGRLRSCARGSSFAFSAAATSASPAEIAAAQEAAAAQGLVVRAIKEKKNAGEASKDEVDAEVAKLLSLIHI